MREGGLDQSGGKSKGSKKWSDFEYILKAELTAFADGLDIGCERKEKLVFFPYF